MPSLKKTNRHNLTPRELTAVDRFMATGDKENSARAAGIKTSSGTHQMFNRERVQLEIADRQEQLRAKLSFDEERLVEEYCKIAFLDPGDFMDWAGNTVTVKSKDEVPASMRGAIKSIKYKQATKEDSACIEVVFHDKMAALDALSKHAGFFQKDNEQKSYPAFLQQIVINEQEKKK